MKHLILHFGQLTSELDSNSFSIYNLENIFQKNEKGTSQIEITLKGINEKDLFLYRVSSKITDEKHDSIIIFKEGFKWEEVIRLAVYLRLLPDDNWISKAPIIICCDNIPNPICDRELLDITDIQNFFNIPGIFYKSYFTLFGKGINDEGENDFHINCFLKSINKDFDINKINIISENLANDRHSITNQWGAVKLALNAGYEIEDINYSFPPTLYFNYLIKKYGIKPNPNKEKTNFGNLLKVGKILLIDDNFDKGWQASLEKIFEPAKVDVAEDYEKINQFGNLKDLREYDLIFLDLRLPKIQNKDINYYYGIDLLKKIKERYPQVPVIVFTASNKAWTREDVVNYGADGMYVKESPEYAGDENFSKENFNNFSKTVKETLEKYKVLRPYWEEIQNIFNNQTFLYIPEKGNTKFKERIEERLKMFYGLLKRGFEQTEFNKEQFHFSDYELAFMTLWSILNEISEANYNKSQPNITILDSAGSLVSNHPCGQPLTYYPKHFKWEIIGQSDIFIEYTYSLSIDSETGRPKTNSSGRYYNLTHEQKSCFFYKDKQFQVDDPPAKTDLNYEKTLYLQIAFLIERKANLSNSINKSNFQNTLVRLNDVRNQLYLTHGSDIKSGFYNQTEKDKRGNHTITPKDDIKDLFELVVFLLTGNEIKLLIN